MKNLLAPTSPTDNYKSNNIDDRRINIDKRKLIISSFTPNYFDKLKHTILLITV